jgi:hypothetical protein
MAGISAVTWLFIKAEPDGIAFNFTMAGEGLYT